MYISYRINSDCYLNSSFIIIGGRWKKHRVLSLNPLNFSLDRMMFRWFRLTYFNYTFDMGQESSVCVVVSSRERKEVKYKLLCLRGLQYVKRLFSKRFNRSVIVYSVYVVPFLVGSTYSPRPRTDSVLHELLLYRLVSRYLDIRRQGSVCGTLLFLVPQSLRLFFRHRYIGR